MPKQPPDQGPDPVPQAPPPSAKNASDGMTEARTLVRRYLPDMARFLAAVALSPDSEAALHSRVLAVSKLMELGGVLPPPMPSAPSSGGSGDGAGEGRGPG